MDNNFNDGTKYRATRNLNVSLENPQFNVEDTHDVNLNDNLVSVSVESKNNDHLDSGFNNVKIENYYSNFQNNTVNNQNDIGNGTSDNKVGNEEIIVDTYLNNSDNNLSNNTSVNNNMDYDDSESNIRDNKITYTPVGKSKKKKASLMIPKELLILFILVLIILVFIYIIPSLYEFFRGIRLSIVR